MRTSTVVALVAASLVNAAIYTTNPVATTSIQAGQSTLVQWNDDGNQPILAMIGPCSIDLCTGGVQQQTCLENITPSLDVSTNAQVAFSPNPSIGPSGAYYFIKYTSLTFKDPTNPQFPYTAYSAKFALTAMTGQFNATVSAQLAGSAVAPGVAASTPAVTTPTGSQTMVTAKPTGTGTASAARTTTAATAAAKTNGALTTAVASFPGMALIAGLVMGAATLF